MTNDVLDILRNEILKIHPKMDEESLLHGLTFFKQKSVKAKEVVLKRGEVCTNLYFAQHSISRCFYENQSGEEHTLWMKPEHQFITEYKSFVGETASDFSLQFYENSEVLYISRKDLLNLYKSDIEWSQFGVLLTEHLHVVLIDVFVNLLSNDATQNYQYIEYMFPRFIQVAPLKDIASMLQISPVTLSRIRSGSQKKY